MTLTLATLLFGCAAEELSGSALPLVATTQDGGEVLIGTVDSLTHEVWFNGPAVDAFENAIGDTGYRLELNGEAFVPTTSGGVLGLVSADPSPVIARLQDAPDRIVTELRVESPAWVDGMPEADANTSFANCFLGPRGSQTVQGPNDPCARPLGDPLRPACCDFFCTEEIAQPEW